MNIRSAWDRIQGTPRRRTFLIAALGVAVVALIIPKGQEEKEAWSLFRLNEIKGGTTSPVLYLSGKFTETWKRAPGSPAPRSGRFEMYIRGTKYYFLNCWHGNPTNGPGEVVRLLSQFLPFVGRWYSGWSQVEVVVNDFDLTMNRRWGSFGSQGGGGGGCGRADSLAPGRRLWNQSGFIGAVEEGQVNMEWYATETFKHLMKVGAYRIPRVIEFNYRDYSQTFRVKKCEFRNGPAPDWFLARKKEYYREAEEQPIPVKTNSPSASWQ